MRAIRPGGSCSCAPAPGGTPSTAVITTATNAVIQILDVFMAFLPTLSANRDFKKKFRPQNCLSQATNSAVSDWHPDAREGHNPQEKGPGEFKMGKGTS